MSTVTDRAVSAAGAPSRRWRYVIPVAAVMDLPASPDRNNVAVILPRKGHADPDLVGWLTDRTGSDSTGFAALAGFLAVAVVLVTLVLRPRPAQPPAGASYRQPVGQPQRVGQR